MARYSQQFEISLPNESTKHTDIQSLEDPIRKTLGDEAIVNSHHSVRTIERDEREVREKGGSPIKQVGVLVIEIYLDEYYHSRSPEQYVSDNSQLLTEKLSDLGVNINPVFNSAAPVPK